MKQIETHLLGSSARASGVRGMNSAWLVLALAVAVALVGTLSARPARSEEPVSKFDVYGFAHFDYIQDFNRVDPAWAATLRSSKIPTTPGAYGADGQAILSARQSRLGASAMLPTDNGPVFAKFEFDMFGVGADAGQTTIRLRHAYGTWNGWLAGQTNTLFMDVDLFPNVVDYWGPTGMVFLRNPQLRFTKQMKDNVFAIAIEQPGNDADVGQLRDIDPTLGGVTSHSEVPDLTANFRVNKAWGHVQVAGIGRRLGYDTPGATDAKPKGTKTGGGVDLSLVLNTKDKKNKLMLGGVFGNGIANLMNDGGTDLAADGTLANPTAKAVPLQGYIAYIDHQWNPKFSSSAGWSRTQVDNTTLQTDGAFKSADYASVNLLVYPTKNVFFGIEGLWGERQDKNGAKGDDRRIQVSAHYSFSSLDFK
jgi:DcaP outer membrane protein